MAGSVDDAKAIELEDAENCQWVAGLVGGYTSGLTMRGRAASLGKQLVRGPFLQLGGSLPESCLLVMLLNSLLEHLPRAFWVTEKYTLCTFPLFAVDQCVRV